MELADFFAIDRLSQHDEELLIESAMQMQQMMMLYESGIREIKTKLDILSGLKKIRMCVAYDIDGVRYDYIAYFGQAKPDRCHQEPHQKSAQHYRQAQAARISDHAAVHDRQSE